MELPTSTSGNRYVIVFQDLFMKWPIVVPIPDQKAVRIAQILVEEVIPTFGVPEVLLSVLFLMKDVCTMLGINTTPQAIPNATVLLRDSIEHSR